MASFKKVWLNHDGLSLIFSELAEEGLLKFTKDGIMRGVGGLSSVPKWDDRWDGMKWTNSSIKLTKKGISVLKKSSIRGWEVE